MEVPFATLNYLHNEMQQDLTDAFNEVMRSGIFIKGKKLNEFEEDFASFCGAKYAVGCGNGLDAITLTLRALNIKEGDEVIVPSFTFIATALAVVYAGAKPVFVDVDRVSCNIDISKIEAAITLKTKAIIPVHLYGQLADMTRIKAIAQKHNLKIIEDCAQAHGASRGGKQAGTFGHAGTYSFYPGKNLGALGDGGAIVTDEYDLKEKVEALANYGSKIKYLHDYAGVNSRLDELQAAFLKVKLKTLDKVTKFRRGIAKKYCERLNHKDMVFPVYPEEEASHVWHVFAIKTERRAALQKYLGDNGIGTLIHYPIPMFEQKSLQYLNYNAKQFPVAKSLSDSVLSLPLYYGMTEPELNYVVHAVNKFGK